MTGSAPEVPPARGLTVLVGGVGQLFQSDQDLGRLVVEQVQDLAMTPGVLVEDLSYGAIPVVHRLAEVRPDVLVLVGTTSSGRRPGRVDRRVVTGVDRSDADLQGAVQDAGTGYVDLSLTIEVIVGLQAMPPRMVVVDIEPAETGPGEGLSAPVRATMPRVVSLVRREVDLAPLFDLAAQVRTRLDDTRATTSPILSGLADMVEAIELLDREDRWGPMFAAMERLRAAVARGDGSEGMGHADWGMTWGLVEEVQRLRGRSLQDPDW